MKTITILEQDVVLAKQARHHDNLTNICTICPVFQALKREGIPVKEVLIEEYMTPEDRLVKLKNTRSVTTLSSSQWGSIIGHTFYADTL